MLVDTKSGVIWKYNNNNYDDSNYDNIMICYYYDSKKFYSIYCKLGIILMFIIS